MLDVPEWWCSGVAVVAARRTPRVAGWSHPTAYTIPGIHQSLNPEKVLTLEEVILRAVQKFDLDDFDVAPSDSGEGFLDSFG